MPNKEAISLSSYSSVMQFNTHLKIVMLILRFGGMSVKSLDYYMNLNYEINIKKNEKDRGYLISLPELKGCKTFANDVADGVERIQEVKKEWIIEALENNSSIPEPEY